MGLLTFVTCCMPLGMVATSDVMNFAINKCMSTEKILHLCWRLNLSIVSSMHGPEHRSFFYFFVFSLMQALWPWEGHPVGKGTMHAYV